MDGPEVEITRQEIERLGPWFHNLHLPGGLQTCPSHFLGDYPSFKWRQLAPHLPRDLRGWSVLDVGCNAGFYSFELAQRGAEVTAIDASAHYLRQARWAASRLGLEGRIRFEQRQVYDLAKSEMRHDLVLFMGVFYHLRYPLLALDMVSRRVGRLLVFQSLSMPGREAAATPEDVDIEDRRQLTAPSWPKMAFIEKKLAADQTNWWAPNHACTEALLRSTGMRIVARPLEETYLCEPDREGESSHWTWNEEEYLAAVGAGEKGSRG